jgi:hypothetical protein
VPSQIVVVAVIMQFNKSVHMTYSLLLLTHYLFKELSLEGLHFISFSIFFCLLEKIQYFEASFTKCSNELDSRLSKDSNYSSCTHCLWEAAL